MIENIILTLFIIIFYHLTASFGGIFGLCLGGSVISFIELIYFFTLRLYSILIHQRTVSNVIDSKRPSLSSSIKTIDFKPKIFFMDPKSYNQNERYRKMAKIKTTHLKVPSGPWMDKTPYQEYNKPGVQQFLN